jgi:small subunit ribosomal protein S13
MSFKKFKLLYLLLTKNTGISKKIAFNVCYKHGLNPFIQINYLTKIELDTLKNYIEKTYLINSKLKEEIQSNIKNLIKIKCYKGLRHLNGLPSRGQRTKTNAKTVKKFFKIYKSKQQKQNPVNLKKIKIQIKKNVKK